jgi:hypothetical protein
VVGNADAGLKRRMSQMNEYEYEMTSAADAGLLAAAPVSTSSHPHIPCIPVCVCGSHQPTTATPSRASLVHDLEGKVAAVHTTTTTTTDLRLHDIWVAYSFIRLPFVLCSGIGFNITIVRVAGGQE